MNKKSSAKLNLLIFTLSYALLMGLIFLFFRLQGRSLVYQGDGWRQHLRALCYYGKYLRGTLRHLVSDRTLSPETWGIDIGYGADVITTLQYYCLGDPLAALSVFVPTKYTMMLYEALILIRPYFAGLAFILYAGVRGEKTVSPVLTGALIYTFSGTVLYIGFLHPYFVNPMIYFPLMLSGVEVALKPHADDEKPLRRYAPFSAAVAIGALCNFYFFYMLAIFTAAYGIARLLMLNFPGTGLRTALRDGLRLLASAIVGTLTAGVTLIPVLVQFKDNPRTGVGFETQVIYDPSYYKELLLNLVSWINHPQWDTELCFSLTFIPLCLVIIFKKGHRTLKACLVLTILLLIFPAGGIALNGFSYMINRWTWAAAMLAGWIALRGVQEFNLYLSTCGKGIRRFAPVTPALLPVCTSLSIGWNIVYGFSPAFKAFPDEFLKVMSPDEYLEASASNEVSAVAAAGGISDEDFYRYSGRNLNWNAALGSGLSSTQFEFSLANGVVSDYFTLIGNNDEQNFAYLELDDRLSLLSLAGVKYYTLAYDNYYEYRFLPIGSADLGMIGGYHVYENPFALPVCYTMDTIIPMEEFLKLDLCEREEALTIAAVPAADINSPTSSSGLKLLAADDIKDKTSQLRADIDIEPSSGVEATDSTFSVKDTDDEDRTVTLKLDADFGCEVLLMIKNLAVEGSESVYNIGVTSRLDGEDFVTKTISYKAPSSQYYSNWHDFVVNMGYMERAADELVISLPSRGVYSFEDISVILRDESALADRLSELGRIKPENLDTRENPISHATNGLSCVINAENDALLVFSLPYSSGFSAKIDGLPADIIRTDGMFFSVPVNAGRHSIELSYRTPGYFGGLACTIAGASAIIFMLLFRKKLFHDKGA